MSEFTEGKSKMVKFGTRDRSHMNLGGALLLWFSAILLSIVFGLTLAFGIYPLTIGFFVLIAGAILVLNPMAGTWIVIIGSLIFAGLIDLYVPALQPIKWALAGLSMGIAFIAYVFSVNASKKVKKIENVSTSLIFWLWTFFTYVILISLFNWHGVGQFLTSFKGYFQVWGILVALYFLIQKENDANKIFNFLLILGIIQLPFIFHQFFVLIPQRSTEEFAMKGIVAADVVAGTFGGTMMGGGRSSSLALLCALGITLTLAYLRENLWSYFKAAVFFSIFLVPMFMSEAKLFIVLLPAALFLLYKDKLLKNPLKFISGTIGLVVLLSSIFFAYSLIPGAESQQDLSLKDMWESNASYNFGDRGYGNAFLNRSTVYSFWVSEHSEPSEFLNALLGHGPGEVQGGVLVNSSSGLLKKYPGYGIGLTGISSLLWELGLVGLLLVIMIMISAYRLAGGLSRYWQGSANIPMLKTSQIAVILFSLSLLHNNYLFFDLSYQALFVIIFGYLLVMYKVANREMKRG